MTHLPSGTVTLVDLPGTGSIMSRTYAVYKKLLPQLLTISFFVIITWVVNITLNSTLHLITKDSVQLVQAFIGIVSLGLSLVAAGFYSLFFAASVIVVREYAARKTLTATQAIMMAKKSYLSLVWIGVITALIVYGSALVVVLPLIFSVWFYFAAYLVVTDDVRGMAALAKSHYLARGLWWKIVGRTVATFASYLAIALAILMVTLPIPVIGWALGMVLIAALALFAFPFQVIYDMVRFEDLLAVQRSREFLYFRGERVMMMVFGIIGIVFATTSWSISLLGCGAQAAIESKMANGALALIIKVAPALSDNVEKLGGFAKKMTYTYPACVSPTPLTPTTDTTQQQIQDSTTTPNY